MNIVIDWDGTVVEEEWPKFTTSWKPGAVEALNLLLEEGHDLTINSCRLSPYYRSGNRRTPSAIFRNAQYIEKSLKSVGLQGWVKLHRKLGKPGADIYIDDRAIHFQTWEDTLRQVGDRNALLVHRS